jgi:NADPH-dependent glutamate synthase beta subunit-like oxidoreductase/Pyruvate/2-oxoacid:ferredoxin oxidoreductase delta subunit
MPTLTLDGRSIPFEAGDSILRAAQRQDIYIPTLCYHPDLPEAEECRLCAVKVDGKGLVQACATPAEDGLVVQSEADEVTGARRERLAAILATHPHACLTCAQAEGCPRTQCSTNVPEPERCCPKLGNCELQRVAAHIGIPADTPRYVPAGLPRLTEGVLFEHDLNLCVACTRCLRACRDLRGVDVLEKTDIEGRTVVVPRNGSDLVETHCRFCGACVEVCPTGAIMDKAPRGGDRRERLLPCASACPAGVDIPGYLRLAAQGRFDDALRLILSHAPLAGVLGRICPAPCETACRRDDLGGSTAIAAVKRACAEYGHAERLPIKVGPDTGKSVAVVGAGPAGLTAAGELRRLGHQVTLLDEQERPGGLLRSGLPSFRLPTDVVDRDVEQVLATGVEFHPSVRVGRDMMISELLDRHEAVLVAVGAQGARQIVLENSELAGVHWGMDLLRAAARGLAPTLSGRAIVIGGGSVAVDCAMTALRLGASSAVLCALESREDLPAHPADLDLALEEPIELLPSWGPRRIVEQEGRVSGVELMRCTSVFDDGGAFAPEFDHAVRRIVEGRTVILAIGQEVDPQVLRGLAAFDEHRGPIPGRDRGYETGVHGLFACGDALASTSTVIAAIRSGREAAVAVDRYLGGDGAVPVPSDLGRGEARIGRVEGFARRERATAPRAPAGERTTGWDEITATLSREAAMAEAGRCLQCDLRLEISAPPVPPRRLLELTPERLEAIPEAAGVYKLYDADQALYAIAGTANLRESLEERLDSEKAAFCEIELNEMYTARESELLQQYLAEHGRLPEGEDDLDDLF